MSLKGEHLNKALAILTSQMPLTTIYHWNICYLKKPYIKNLYVQPSGSFFLNRVEIDQVNRDPSPREKDYLWTAVN